MFAAFAQPGGTFAAFAQLGETLADCRRVLETCEGLERRREVAIGCLEPTFGIFSAAGEACTRAVSDRRTRG